MGLDDGWEWLQFIIKYSDWYKLALFHIWKTKINFILKDGS